MKIPKNVKKTMLPRTDKPRHEPDLQAAPPVDPQRKPQQVKDFEERHR